jgi:L-asparagine transporter-like permease
MNANTYLTGRMLFSLSRGNYAPRQFGVLNKAGAPAPAVLFSGGVILACAMVSRLTPLAYNYLFGVSLFGALFVWIVILVSHIAFRRRHGAEALPVRMPFFPTLQIAGLALLLAILVTMGLSPDFNVSWIVGVPWLILLTTAYFLRKPRGA